MDSRNSSYKLEEWLLIKKTTGSQDPLSLSKRQNMFTKKKIRILYLFEVSGNLRREWTPSRMWGFTEAIGVEKEKQGILYTVLFSFSPLRPLKLPCFEWKKVLLRNILWDCNFSKLIFINKMWVCLYKAYTVCLHPRYTSHLGYFL